MGPAKAGKQGRVKARGTLWDDGKVLCLEYGGHTTIYICQNSSNCA